MEGVKNEMRRQIIMTFYRKNDAKGMPYIINFFGQLGVTRRQVYRAIARVECGESHLQKKGAGAPRKLSKPREKQIAKSLENKNCSSLQ